MKTYSEAKKKYNKVLPDYGEAFQKCNSKIKFYKSKANFFLGELINPNYTVEDLMLFLLVENRIYLKMCGDKSGLDDIFFRISCRNEEENAKIIEALKSL